MTPRAVLREAGLEATARPARLSGGDMGEVWRVGDLVVKSHPSPPPGLFPAEARGLARLAAAGVRVPRVHWSGEAGIVMEHLPSGPARWDDLADQVALLHGTRAVAYGLDEPVFLGRFPLPAATSRDWRALWAEHRVGPLLDATRAQLGPLADEVERVLETFAPPVEGPVLLHGDLWGGNVHMSEAGAALIDPSAWYGERAVDLAMMKLFGGFPAEFWSAYERARPIGPEVRRALPYHQLYFLLVHVHFFGAGYLHGVCQALRELR